jgi:Nucleotidyl transferase AbiEii toxin, Type IV TA system
MKDHHLLWNAIAEVRRTDEHCQNDQDAARTLVLIACAEALSKCPEAFESLCLKGGTLLRMLVGGSIGRPPSMDLDATLIAHDFEPARLEVALGQGLGDALRYRFGTALSASITLIPQSPARRPDLDSAQHVFRIRASAALNRAAPLRHSRIEPVSFAFEVTADEFVSKAHLMEYIRELHGFHIRMLAYAPVQSIAEKLRALLQKLRHYENKLAMGRNPADPGLLGNFIPRHVLDLELLLPMVTDNHLLTLPEIFARKCAAKGIPPVERTMSRLLHPLLRQQVLSKATPWRDPARAWTILERLAALVTAVDPSTPGVESTSSP